MPTPVIVVACLLVVGGLSCFACMFLPYPAFLFGQIIPLPYSRAVYIGLGVWSGALGAGLFRLNNQFRIATLAFLGIWGAHLAMILTPWYRGRFATYNNLIYGQMHMPIPSTALFTGGLLSFSGIVGILFYGAMAWILHHYRAAFITTQTLRDSHAAG